ncbi:hypothetical protein D3C71_892430 [compost metagenome]
MKLTNYLKDAGYDLIEGPIRNQKPLQLWLKQDLNEAELYYSDVNHAFTSSVALNIIEDPALSVDTTKTDEYNFNIGISLLENILKSMGLGSFEVSANIKSGKKVTISYNNSVTRVIPVGEITDYLATADFNHVNPVLLKNANRNNILIITGVVMAKNLNVDIETDFNVDAGVVASLNKAAEGKLDFTSKSQQTLKMVSNANTFFPIAVKASRIQFEKGIFKGLKLITDNRNFF